MIVDARIDLNSIGMTIDEWKTFIGNNPWREYVPVEPVTVWSNHQRNLLIGWTKIGDAGDFSTAGIMSGDFLTKPGTYALVYDPAGIVENPIIENKTIKFGETTQAAWKRIYSHVGGIRGKTTNTSENWNKSIDRVANHFGVSKYSIRPRDITLFFRPHDVTDLDHQFDRRHSQEMETQAQALYFALHGIYAPGNSRDMPYWFHINRARDFLVENGFKVPEIV